MILSALRSRGAMTRTGLVDLFGRHMDKGRIEAALTLLQGLGRIRCTKESTGGRPAETWHAV